MPLKTISRRSALALCLLLTLATTRAAQTPEFRALWVDSWGAGFLNTSQVTKLVSDCRQYNFNAVLVQVRRRGDAFYMPGAENPDPRTTAIAANYDALAEIIAQCHNGSPRIEVHAWLVCNLVWSGSTLPSQPGHVVNAHPEYLMRDSAGRTQIGEGTYLDPGHPDASAWNHRVALDIARRYDIDGLHWDYIRYPQQDAGYNEVALARYKAEFGITTTPAPSSPHFGQWRRRQVTDFLRWTTADLLAVKPGLIVSAAVFANRDDAYTHRFQDWAAWNAEGILDITMPMNYSANTSGVFSPRLLDASVRSGVRTIYMGQGSYLNTKENTAAQLQLVRDAGLKGTILFSYRTPNSGTVNQTATFAHLRSQYQPAWAPVPLLPWKAAPAKGIVRGIVREPGAVNPAYNASVSIPGHPRAVRTNPQGHFALFEITPGTHTISATAPGLGTAQLTVNVVAGRVSTANMDLPSGDSVPPVLANIRAVDLTDRAAVIEWTTDEMATSMVRYGISSSSEFQAGNPQERLAHSMALTALQPATSYRFRVESADASGNTATSQEFTFRTLPEGAVNDIVMDNPSASVAGSWTLASSSTDKFGANYLYKGQGNGSAFVEFVPRILAPGAYRVYEWHPQGSNRSEAAPHQIVFDGGSTNIAVNQKINGGAWRILGTFPFAAGTGGRVIIRDSSPDAGLVIMADAVKFEFVSPPPRPPAARIARIEITPDQHVLLEWSADPGRQFIIELSTDLDAWTELQNITSSSADYEFRDPLHQELPLRFYRLKEVF